MIDPEVEKSTRRLLGHAVRGELDDLTGSLSELGPECVLGCLNLCLRISGYIVIDVCGHKWPSEGNLHEIAQRMSEVDLDFNLAVLLWSRLKHATTAGTR